MRDLHTVRIPIVLRRKTPEERELSRMQPGSPFGLRSINHSRGVGALINAMSNLTGRPPPRCTFHDAHQPEAVLTCAHALYFLVKTLS